MSIHRNRVLSQMNQSESGCVSFDEYRLLLVGLADCRCYAVYWIWMCSSLSFLLDCQVCLVMEFAEGGSLYSGNVTYVLIQYGVIHL